MNRLDEVDIWPYLGSFCLLDLGRLLTFVQAFISEIHLSHGFMQRICTRLQQVIFNEDSMGKKIIPAPRFEPTACVFIQCIAATLSLICFASYDKQSLMTPNVLLNCSKCWWIVMCVAHSILYVSVCAEIKQNSINIIAPLLCQLRTWDPTVKIGREPSTRQEMKTQPPDQGTCTLQLLCHSSLGSFNLYGY